MMANSDGSRPSEDTEPIIKNACLLCPVSFWVEVEVRFYKRI